MNKKLGFVTSCLCFCYCLEQSAMFLLYLEIGSRKIYEIFMGGTRLKHLSNTSGITFLYDLVREI
jgi:hypothetical protein